MANYYTTFSFTVDELTPEEEKWLEEEYQKMENGESELVDDASAFALELKEDLAAGTQKVTTYAWFHTNESGDPDQTADFLLFFLQSWRPKEAIGFEWAASCSSLRTDGFGGGAYFVTAKKVTAMSSSDWLSKQQKRFEKMHKT